MSGREFISQRALSQQIPRLESELGIKLLERNSRSFHLTREPKPSLLEAQMTRAL